jgi:hypothetical protein
MTNFLAILLAGGAVLSIIGLRKLALSKEQERLRRGGLILFFNMHSADSHSTLAEGIPKNSYCQGKQYCYGGSAEVVARHILAS